MSDITGPPAPKPVSPQGTDRASRTSPDPHQSSNHAPGEKGDRQTQGEAREPATARDPAVSISSSAAHVEVGEQVRETVRAIDHEGRPIIETDKATFALRPDAGLKPGDEVKLEVTEAGKKVAADLLEKNGADIKPPIRLSLTVIAIHGIEPESETASNRPALDTTVSYQPRGANASLPQASQSTQSQDPAALAALLSRGAQTNVSQTSLGPADNPDPLIKSNSQDLATLIAAQGATSVGKAGNQQAPVNTAQNSVVNLQNMQASSARILGDNSLIAPLQNAVETALSAAQGLGAPVIGLTAAGAQVSVQIMDISVSQVPPSEVAQVLSVQPLSTEMAKALPVGAQTVGGEALASVTTDNKGVLVLPQTYANNLTGETIRVAPFTTEVTEEAQQKPNQPQLQTYSARLTAPESDHARKIAVAILSNDANTATAQSNIQTASINAVHTARAFLTGEGPMNDLKLDTAIGTVSVTLPTGIRPSPGDLLAIVQQKAVDTAAATTAQGQIAQTGLPAGETAATTLTASTWPTFEQTYSLLQATSPTAASQLAGRTAQGGPKLLNSMMFLMAALKGGDPSAWLGKTTEATMQQRAGGLLDQLKEDISKLWNSGAETTTEWRSFMIPLDARASDMPMIAALFAQPHKIDPDQDSDAETANEDSDDSQRFIIEATFSELGAMQLEGLIRKKQFDLTLWSERGLPRPLTDDLTVLFITALESNGFKGRLGFKAEEPFPVDVAAVLERQLAA